MATLKYKVWKKKTPASPLTFEQLLPGEDILIMSKEGTEDQERLNIVPYGSNINTQNLLNLAADLAYNDYMLNNEKTASNEIISEGVFEIVGSGLSDAEEAELALLVASRDRGWTQDDGSGNYVTMGYQDIIDDYQRLLELIREKYWGTFFLEVDADDDKLLHLGPGILKILEEGNETNIYQIEDSTNITVNNILTANYYRRDMIGLVFRDTGGTTPTPYIEYVYGVETATAESKHTMLDKQLTSTYGIYPLWSVLVKNTAGLTAVSRFDQVYNFAGLNSLTLFEDTKPYQMSNNSFRFHRYKNAQLRNIAGEYLTYSYGQTPDQESLAGPTYLPDSIASSIVQDTPIDLDALNDDDSANLHFPFILESRYSEFVSYDSVEFRKFTIAIEDPGAIPPADMEGMEVHFYTADYLVDGTHNGILSVINTGGVVDYEVSSGYGRIHIDRDPRTWTQQTSNTKTYTTASAGASADDFIIVSSGTGQWQKAKIHSIEEVSGEYVLLTTPLAIPVDSSDSAIMIFKSDSEKAIGTDITTTWLDGLETDERQDYIDQYPYSSNTGISILPWDDSGIDVKSFVDSVQAGPAWPDPNTLYVYGTKIPVDFPVKLRLNLNQWYFSKIIVKRKQVAAPTYGTMCQVLVQTDNDPALLTRNGYFVTEYYTNKGAYPGISEDGTTFFIMEDSWGDIADDGTQIAIAEVFEITCEADVAGSLGGKWLTLNSTTTEYYAWFNVDGGSTDPAIAGKTGIEVAITTNETADGVATALRVAIGALGDFSGSGVNPIVEITNLIAGVTINATLGNTLWSTPILITTSGQDAGDNRGALRVASGYPPKWIPQAKNLDPENFAKPTARTFSTDPATVYVDVINGIVAFNDAEIPDTDDFIATFAMENIVTGKADTDSIIHIEDPTLITQATMTLARKLENIDAEILLLQTTAAAERIMKHRSTWARPEPDATNPLKANLINEGIDGFGTYILVSDEAGDPLSFHLIEQPDPISRLYTIDSGPNAGLGADPYTEADAKHSSYTLSPTYFQIPIVADFNAVDTLGTAYRIPLSANSVDLFLQHGNQLKHKRVGFRLANTGVKSTDMGFGSGAGARAGYQEFGLSVTAGSNAGLDNLIEHVFKVNSVQYSIIAGVNSTYTELVSLIDAQITGAGFTASIKWTDPESDIRITNDTAGLGNDVLIESGVAVNATSGYDSVNTGGGKTGATASGLTPTTVYDFQVNIDGAGLFNYSITTGGTTTYDDIMPLMEAELTGATVSIVGGELTVTSTSTGTTSTIALSAGTGTDLFASLTGWVGFQVAVDGLNKINDLITEFGTTLDDAVPGADLADWIKLHVALHNNTHTYELTSEMDYTVAEHIYDNSLGDFYIYFDLPATLPVDSYHYHIAVFDDDGTPVNAPMLTRFGVADGEIIRAPYYIPTAGNYGSSDYPFLLDKNGNDLIWETTNVTDDVIDTVLNIPPAKRIDKINISPADLSTPTLWDNWAYENYIGVDVRTGRIKFSNVPYETFVEFNSVWNMSKITGKGFPSGEPDASMADYNKETFVDKELLQQTITNLTNKNSDLTHKLETETKLNMNQQITLDYILKSNKAGGDNALIDLYNSENNSDFNNLITPAKINDDNDWNNNWKFDEASQTFKFGNLAPTNMNYMLEITDEFNLEGVGQIYKGAIDYDAVNNCYWLMTNAGNNAIGEITKLSVNMKDGKVDVLARYMIPIPGIASTWWTGIATDGSKLWIVLHGLNTNSKVYGYNINSDGSIGEAGYEAYNGQSVDLVNSPYATHTSSQTGYYSDVISWDSNDIMVLNCNSTTDVSLISLDKSTLGAGTASNIVGFENYVGGTTSGERSLCISNNYIYMRVNDYVDDLRFIYRFNISTDIVSDAVIKSSGRWSTTRSIDFITGSNEGICVGHHGDILEVTSTASNGKFISRRALKNAVWAENQVCGEKKMNASTPPIWAVGLMIDLNGNYWTSDTSTTAQQVDLYRFDTDGSKHSVRLIGATRAWVGAIELTTDGTSVWMIGFDGTNYEVIKGSLATLNTAIELSSDYDATNTLDIDTWGTVCTGIGETNTDTFGGIVYADDNSILYLINATDNKIDTLSEDGATWTQGVYDLPTPTTTWHSVAYKNKILYIRNSGADTNPNQVYSIPLLKANSISMWRSHIYQDSGKAVAGAYIADDSRGIAFDGNDLVSVHRASLTFTKMKVLEDPDVMQLHNFIDEYNILLTSNISCTTPIVKRHFNPEEYTEKLPFDSTGKYNPNPNEFDHYETILSRRNVPDKNFMGVAYRDEGFSLLHLDEFFSGRSSSGMPRRDVTKIRVEHAKKGSGSSVLPTSATGYNMLGNLQSRVDSIFIEKDIIFTGNSVASSYADQTLIINLKSDQAVLLTRGDGVFPYSGYIYNGAWSERNDEKGYIGQENIELSLSSNVTNKIHARTFTKDNISDYNGENPVTVVAIGTDGGCDLLRIDWDENGNRTPVKVFNNVCEGDMGKHAVFIDDFGYLFTGDWGTTGKIIYGNKPVWEVNKDNCYTYNDTDESTEVGLNIFGTYVRDISPNSRCWKTASGELRRQLTIGGAEISQLNYTRTGIVDVENETLELMTHHDGYVTTYFNQIDNFEDKVFIAYYIGASDKGLCIFNKLHFNDDVQDQFKNGWTTHLSRAGNIFMADNSRPMFSISRIGSGTEGAKGIRYSKDYGILAFADGDWGLQFIHLNNQVNNSQQKSQIIDCSNPEKAVINQSVILSDEE